MASMLPKVAKLEQCVLLNTYPQRCVVTQRMMPYHPALLQLRRVQDLNDPQKTFYTPDVNAHAIRRNVFCDREDPSKFYGLADVVFCYANADALKAL